MKVNIISSFHQNAVYGMIIAQEAGKKLTLMAAVCGLVSLLRRFQAGLAFPLKYLINQADFQFS